MVEEKGVHDRSLRQQAEERLEKLAEKPSDAAERDPRTLVHELQVHQVELEMQNEELRRAQQEADVLRSRYQDLYDFAPIGYLTLDVAGRVTEANLAAASLLGWERQRLVGSPLFVFLALSSRKEYDSFLGRLLAGESGANCEARLGANARREGWLLLEGGPPGGGEALQQRRVALIDITDRKAAEAMLRNRTSELEAVFSAFPDLYFWIDAEERILDYRARAVTDLYLQPEEFLGKRMQDVLPPEVGQQLHEAFQQVLEKGSSAAVEYWLSIGGVDKAFEARALPLREGRVLFVVRDITERRRAEEAIERLNTDLEARAAELESANAELEAFNYTVAHDLRQPLNIINSYCQVIKEMCAPNLDEQCQGFLGEAYGATLRMDGLIDALLNLSRLANVEPRREGVDLSALARDIATGLKLTGTERRCNFRIADGIAGYGDPKLLRMVLENLLGNAWKYTGDREEAVIEFGVTDVDGTPAFFVRDNGAGFDLADAAKLFLPFQRLHGPEKFNGFGVGLASVERIIRRHGGKVWADGEPGKGATFYFTLP